MPDQIGYSLANLKTWVIYNLRMLPIRQLAKTPIHELTFSVVDVETTGMSPQFNRVIDIGLVKIKNGEIVETWESLINPKQDIPQWITFYTHIKNRHVCNQPTFDFFMDKLESLLQDTIFVGHNAIFDYSFLSQEMQRYNKNFFYPRLCTVLLGRKLLPQLANAHLDAISDYYNIKIKQRHRALPDAEATAYILNEFIHIAKEKYNAKTFFDLERLQYIKVERPQLRQQLQQGLIA